MAASVRRLVLEEALRRLQRITIANGFNTNAGQNVFLGVEVFLSPEDGTVAIAIEVGDAVLDDDVGFGNPIGQELPVRLPLAVQAIADADLDQAWLASEDVLADVKVAMENPDVDSWPSAVKDFGASSPRDSTIERVEGSTAVGAVANYEVLYLETWGAP